jgi:hypothetical protein
MSYVYPKLITYTLIIVTKMLQNLYNFLKMSILAEYFL